MEKKYLPIGSVCTLKGKLKKVMITGYYSVSFNGNLKIKDYLGCTYPEGLLLNDQVVSFNHSEIENVDYLGYKNDDWNTFMKNFNNLTGNVSEEEKAALFHKQNDMVLASSKSYSKLLFDENGVVMIAEPVVPKKETIKFDENGYVIAVESPSGQENPFVYNVTKNQNNKNKNTIKFDENGVVVSDEFEKSKKASLNEIKFDENGIVVSDDSLKAKVEDEYLDIEPIGPGLPGSEYLDVEPIGPGLPGSEYLDVEPIGPGLPGMPKKTKEKYSFDENGNIISSDVEKPKFTFDENGVLVSEN